MKFTERKCWESECVDYLIIEYPEWGEDCFMPQFQGDTTGFSVDTLEGAKAQCEAHTKEQTP